MRAGSSRTLLEVEPERRSGREGAQPYEHDVTATTSVTK